LWVWAEIFNPLHKANYDAHRTALGNPHADGGCGRHCQPAGCVAGADVEGFTVLRLLLIQQLLAPFFIGLEANLAGK
jgi:hypothetical protein